MPAMHIHLPKDYEKRLRKVENMSGEIQRALDLLWGRDGKKRVER